MVRRWTLSAEVRREIFRRRARGATYRQIVEQLDVSMGTVGKVVAPLGGVIRREELERPSSRLSLEDRTAIWQGVVCGWSFARIGASLERPRHASTICREVNKSGGRAKYQPFLAHRLAGQRARRPKATKLAANPRLCARVIRDLQRLWSPEQITRRLRAEFGDDPAMAVSHETIYKSLYVQGRGELRRELERCLRTGRVRRKPQGRLERRGKIPDMVSISQRPAEVEDRAVPGHWEGDLIIGRGGDSAIGTLVERTTRFVLLLHLPRDRSAEAVRDAMTAAVATLPAALVRTITWDQGKEMAAHREFTVATDVAVYFCDPYSPWQRGSNENTNGLLRQYFPKGTDLSVHTAAGLQAAADSLNGRPRKTLGWMTPSEKLAELIATTG
jgi:transposase, IS30 family